MSLPVDGLDEMGFKVFATQTILWIQVKINQVLDLGEVKGWIFPEQTIMEFRLEKTFEVIDSILSPRPPLPHVPKSHDFKF